MRKAPLFLLVMGLLIALAVCQLLLPPREMSGMENRMLTQAPAFTLAGFQDGSYAEKLELFAADQLPLRDRFVALYSAMQGALGRRAVGDAILGDGMLFDRSDRWSLRNVRLNASALASLADAAGKPVYLLAVPSAAAVCPERLPTHAPVTDEEALLAAAAEETPLLPLLPALQASASRGISCFYATDHHWTAAGAQLGYETACSALGLTAHSSGTAQEHAGFYGSFYARYPLPWVQADVFSCELPDGLRLLVNGEEKPSLLDPEALGNRDKYAALLYGNHACIELVNDQAQGGTLLVIKDSYANAMLPLLARHYRRIVAVDPRYYAGNIIEFINDYEGEAILCVYGLTTLATGRTIALLEGL